MLLLLLLLYAAVDVVCCSQLGLCSVRQPQQQRHAHRLTSCCHAAASTGQPTQASWAQLLTLFYFIFQGGTGQQRGTGGGGVPPCCPLSEACWCILVSLVQLLWSWPLHDILLCWSGSDVHAVAHLLSPSISSTACVIQDPSPLLPMLVPLGEKGRALEGERRGPVLHDTGCWVSHFAQTWVRSLVHVVHTTTAHLACPQPTAVPPLPPALLPAFLTGCSSGRRRPLRLLQQTAAA